MKMLAKTRQRRRERGLLDGAPRCSKCDQPNRRASQRYCARCHAEYMKGWRARHVYVSRETLRSTEGRAA